MMGRPTWSIARDGDGELTLWRADSWDDRAPVAVARRSETPPELWALGRLLAHDPGADGPLVNAVGRVAALAAVAALRDLAGVAYRFAAGRPAIELEGLTRRAAAIGRRGEEASQAAVAEAEDVMRALERGGSRGR